MRVSHRRGYLLQALGPWQPQNGDFLRVVGMDKLNWGKV